MPKEIQVFQLQGHHKYENEVEHNLLALHAVHQASLGQEVAILLLN
jgi:hypothetical protein